jgi:hypothetical protein
VPRRVPDGDAPWWRDYAGYLALVTAGLAFIALRLSGLVDWSWWLVLAPVWLLLLAYLGTYAVLSVDSRRNRWRSR